jgi:Dolichyl-phosphate-mannose-protein mannosyltransferase
MRLKISKTCPFGHLYSYVGTGMKDASTGIGLEAAAVKVDAFRAATGVLTAIVAGVLVWLIRLWPPHEDEALALFVGRGSLGYVVHTVVAERGGAPLHFLFAWLVVHAGGGLTALRAVSIVFAVASVPLMAELGARLADRLTGVVAAAFASASWVFLFHGIFARMYSLFLFTSLLSVLALLTALDDGRPRRFALWGAALVLVLASHPYAVLLVAAQVLYVLLRRVHLRRALITLAGVAVVGLPFWWADVVLRNRFDVGIGGGGRRLGSPGAVVRYLWSVAGDFSTHEQVWATCVFALAVAGAVLLVRRKPWAAALTACVIAVPAVAFMVATLGSSTSPEARHLIFVLPFYSVLLALPLTTLARRRPAFAVLAALAAVLVVVGDVRWAHEKTPELFDGDPTGEARARDAAAAWLAVSSRSDDVLLGYEPVFLRAWEQKRSFSDNVLPRADPALFADALAEVPLPLGRGLWVFDASDTTNARQLSTIPLVLPQPKTEFEGRVFGPYLVIRSRRPLLTRERYMGVAERVLQVGSELRINDAEVNLHTIRAAQSRP